MSGSRIGWLGLLARPFYALTRFLNSLAHLSGRRQAVRSLEEFRQLVRSPNDIAIYYVQNGFHWKQDPKIAGITLEWARHPWVTWKQRWGDCEDFMLLNEHLIADVCPDTERWAVSDISGCWHAILVFPWKDGWGLLSNTRFTAYATHEEAITAFYGRRHRSELRM